MPDLEPHESLSSYDLGEIVFVGRETRVHRGRRRFDSKSVYVKRHATASPDSTEIARFRRDFDLGRRVGAAGAVDYVGLVEDGDGVAVITADHGPRSLGESLAPGHPLPLETALRAAIGIARALEAVHAIGIVHGDVKPANVVVDLATGEARLLDFGSAATLSRQNERVAGVEARGATLAYCSPEQTGRTHRSVDTRADLYALGATTFEMLAGRVPFDDEDPLALMHAHLARPAPRLDAATPDVPAIVADIVARLLAKDPDDRYQTARGVIADLETCLDAMGRAVEVDRFRLGRSDSNERFVLAQRLYGREATLASLVERLDAVGEAGSDLIVLGGFPGIGKTSLIDELEHPSIVRSGFFARGRFEQYRRDVPYAGLADAMRQLVRSLDREPAESRGQLTETIKRELGSNARALFDLAPELARLVPDAPPLAALGVEAARHRMTLAVIGLLHAFTLGGRHVVFAIDDLQWADEGSLHLLTELVGGVDRVLLLGALRDNEVGPGHPLELALESIGTKRGRPVERLTLGPLTTDDVENLLADAMRRPKESVAALAKTVHGRTGGNPFFVRELLFAFAERGAIRYDAIEQAFTWNDAIVEATDVGGDVVHWLRTRIDALPARTREVLDIAASLGAEGSIADLATIVGDSASAIADALIPAFTDGLLRTIDGGVRYRFLHDRVQQATIDRLDSAALVDLHLRVGRSLLATANADEDRIIDVASHFAHAIERFVDPAERTAAARVCVRAARRALASSAFDRAEAFLDASRTLAGPDAHRVDPALALEIATMLAATYRAHAKDAAFVALVAELERKFDDPFALAPVYEHYLNHLMRLRDPREALASATRILTRLGIELTLEPTQAHLLPRLARLRLRVAFGAPARPEDLSTFVDPKTLVEAKLLLSVQEQAWTVSEIHGVYFLLELALRAPKLGRTALAGVAWSLAGIAVMAVFKDVKLADQICRLGIELAERDGRGDLVHLTLPGYSALVQPWLGHLEDTLATLMKGYRLALDAGDAHHAAQFPEMYLFHRVFLGHEVASIRRAMNRFASQAARDPGAQVSIRYLAQFLDCLEGHVVDPSRLVGKSFDIELEHAREVDEVTRFGIALHDLWLAVLLGSEERVRESFARADPDSAGARDTIMAAIWPQLATLALARTSRSGFARIRALLRIRRFEKDLGALAKRTPVNVAHRLSFVVAERARLEGDSAAAADAYRESIRLARANRWPHDETLAEERLGDLFAEQGDLPAARGHFREARVGYIRWGATAKVEALRTRVAALEGDGDHPGAKGTSRPTTSTPSASGESLDLLSVIRAAQALSRVDSRDALVSRLLELSAENAGASHGAIVSLHGDTLVLEAEFEVDESGTNRLRRVGRPLHSTSSRVPEDFVRTVLRDGSAVVVDDVLATDAATPELESLRGLGTRSLLALPLGQKGGATGVLVLENALTAGAFTPNRIAVLDVLASQAAISLENAALYTGLENALERQVALTAANRRFVPNEFIAALGHESITSVGLGDGVQREMSVLFSDIRGFTTLVEGMSPEANIAFINEYLAVMEPAILDNGGFVDSYIGDAIMALFEAPADRSLRAGISMLTRLEALNLKRTNRGERPIRIGVGINTGLLTLGTIGGPQRIKCGVIGDAVNLGARVESATKRYGIPMLVTESTVDSLVARHDFCLREIDRVRVVGRKTPTRMFEVFDADPAPLRDAKLRTREDYEAGVSAFRAGAVADARARFVACVAALPDDPVIARRIARCDEILADPTIDSFDDIVNLADK